MHVLNRSTRQWVFGDPTTQFIIPPGPSRVVEVPARLGPDDAKHAKHSKILDGYLKDPNSGLSELPANGSVAVPPSVVAANAEEVTQLKEQIRKLQQLVAGGDSGDALKELQGQLDESQRAGSESKARIGDLEKQLGEALKQPKGRAKG